MFLEEMKQRKSYSIHQHSLDHKLFSINMSYLELPIGGTMKPIFLCIARKTSTEPCPKQKTMVVDKNFMQQFIKIPQRFQTMS